MTANTDVFTLVRTEKPDNYPGKPPVMLFGNGTPAGAIGRFLEAAEGSLYVQVDATDDTNHIWHKVASDGDDSDWLQGPATSGIVNADIASGAAIVGSKLAANARRQSFRSKTFNIDNGSGTTEDEPCFIAVDDIVITAVRRVYTEATDTAGASGALTRVGTAANGEQIVASVACGNSKAVGAADTLTVASGVVAAGSLVFVRHTGIAATEAGQYYIQFDYTVND